MESKENKKKLDIQDVALRYLEHRARTIWEMKKYLKEKEYDETEVEEAILYLLEYRYLNDIDYCLQYIPYAMNKGKGMYRIKRELKEKGISDFDMEDAFYQFENEKSEEFEDDETQGNGENRRALEQAMKVIEGREIDEKLLAKVGRRLSALGYSSGNIYYALGKIKKISTED